MYAIHLLTHKTDILLKIVCFAEEKKYQFLRRMCIVDRMCFGTLISFYFFFLSVPRPLLAFCCSYAAHIIQTSTRFTNINSSLFGALALYFMVVLCTFNIFRKANMVHRMQKVLLFSCF